MPEYSRLGRMQEQKLTRKIILLFAASIIILVLLAFFGFSIFVNMSVLVGNLKGPEESVKPTPTVILAPVLDSVPTATNSAAIPLTGTGDKGLSVIIYVNNKEVTRAQVKDDGSFDAGKIPLENGENTVSAKQTDGKDGLSTLSNIQSTYVELKAPTVELTSPMPDSNIHGDPASIKIAGKTDADNTITANGRFVIVRSDGTFDYPYSLSEGDNLITILVTDPSGNSTKIERTVHYSK